jgi:hypothetical protein
MGSRAGRELALPASARIVPFARGSVPTPLVVSASLAGTFSGRPGL